MAVTNAHLLQALEQLRDDDLAQIKSYLKELNGRQRYTEQEIAALRQWRLDQEALDLPEEVKQLRDRTNFVGAILGLAQLVVAAVGAILFGQDGKI
jgi:hypothetical protein